MKIAIDCRFLNIKNAGLGRYTEELVRHLLLLDRQNDYYLLVRDKKRPPADLIPATANVKLITANYPHYSWQEQLFLPPLLYRLRPDLVHFPHFNHPLLYFGRSIFTIHDLTLNNFNDASRWRRWAYQITMGSAVKKARIIMTASQDIKNELTRLYQLPTDKIAVCYHGGTFSETDRPPPTATNATLAKYHLKSPYLLSIGQLRIHKNLERLIKVFQQITPTTNYYLPTPSLVIVGKINNYGRYLQKLAAGNSRIIFTDFVPDEDLPALYAGATALVFPSLSEGFGLPVLEAMTLSCPVILSNKTSLPEVGGQAAVYFNPEDEQDMASAIKKILSDENLRQKMIIEGKKQAAKFSWAKAAKETLLVYQKAVARR